jgi:steroid 5-alpha reductase family enzyme
MLLISGVAIAVLMLGTWVVSLRLRDASIVDVVWAMGFVMVAWLGFRSATARWGASCW